MKKKMMCIIIVGMFLTTVFGACFTASADAIESILVFVMDGNKPIRNAEVWGESPDGSIYYEKFLVRKRNA